ncbi:efflux RND transporter periplasmic adaptor subunit [Terasakiella sp. A23]|uniref:efflux RND transporter periplasmic adaptor subunit n=1 Tax=Terasakiella sp. FCG-A23 TaxID=3080561 RepID=UPI00295438E6|nr:efflux RND transporter periplasmic adaptor subunit [Terasakiella sp. A23]MDV7340099.1 efflux RND transporter periplasmic adaptor subunit [Terasakiella sp. A23]
MTLPQNKSILIAFSIAVVISLWLVSGQFGDDSAADETATNQTIEMPETQKSTAVTVMISSQTATDHADVISLFGQTHADRSVDIKAETVGNIKEVLIEKGSFVKKGDVIARINIDDRDRSLKSAQALVRQRQLEFEASRKLSQKSFRSQTKLAEAEALLNAARAQLESARLDLAHTEIKAPFDGKLEDRTIEVGDYVEKATMLGQIVDLSPIVVRAEISENDISKIQDGQPASVILNDKRKLDGIVRFVASTSNSTTRTYRIEIESENPNNEIAAGLTAQVRLEVGSNKAYLVSPAILTLSDEGVIGVKTVNDDNIVVFNPVKLLEDTASGIWVSGLPNEARIIARGQEYVSPGQTVQTVEEGQQSEAPAEKEAPALVKAQGN